jgi:hypothetical protein
MTSEGRSAVSLFIPGRLEQPSSFGFGSITDIIVSLVTSNKSLVIVRSHDTASYKKELITLIDFLTSLLKEIGDEATTDQEQLGAPVEQDGGMPLAAETTGIGMGIWVFLTGYFCISLAMYFVPSDVDWMHRALGNTFILWMLALITSFFVHSGIVILLFVVISAIFFGVAYWRMKKPIPVVQ